MTMPSTGAMKYLQKCLVASPSGIVFQECAREQALAQLLSTSQGGMRSKQDENSSDTHTDTHTHNILKPQSPQTHPTDKNNQADSKDFTHPPPYIL